jgi:hypothetical protein
MLVLVRLDIFEAVDDAAADLQIVRALLQPSPSFQSSRTETPPTGKLFLIEMAKIHRGHSKRFERARRMAGDLWVLGWGDCLESGVKSPSGRDF